MINLNKMTRSGDDLGDFSGASDCKTVELVELGFKFYPKVMCSTLYFA